MNTDKSPTWTLLSMFPPLLQPSSVNVFNAESGFLYRCLCHYRAVQSKYVSQSLLSSYFSKHCPLRLLFLPPSYFSYFPPSFIPLLLFSLLHTSLTFPPSLILISLFLPPSYFAYFSFLLNTYLTFPPSFILVISFLCPHLSPAPRILGSCSSPSTSWQHV